MQNSSLTTTNGVSTNADSIFFSKKEISVNHVNLIGKMTALPRFSDLPSGRKIAQFTMSTTEIFLDEKGVTKNQKYWHRICAWGKWVKVLDELGCKDLQIAIEGKLTTRYYYRDGLRQCLLSLRLLPY